MPQVLVRAILRGMDGEPIAGIAVDAIVSPYGSPSLTPSVLGVGVTSDDGSVVFHGQLSKPDYLPRFRLRRNATGANDQEAQQVIAEIVESWSIQAAIGQDRVGDIGRLGPSLKPPAPPGNNPDPVIDFGTVTTSINPLFIIGDTPFYGLHAEALSQLFTLAQTNLVTQVEVLQQEHATLVAARNQLSSANNALLAELSAAQSETAVLQETIAELQADLSEPPSEIAVLQQTITELRVELSAAQSETAVLQETIAELQADLSEPPSEIAVFQQTITELRAELSAAQSETDVLQETIAELQADLSEAPPEIVVLQQTITELQAELEAYKAGVGQRTSVDSVLQGLGEQLGFAQASLASAGALFKVGKLSATLKGFPSPDGTSLIFPTLDQLKNMNGLLLSDINVDFAADAESTRLAEPPPGTVPKVVGMTDVLAARTLQNAGFQSQTSYQTIKAPEQGAVSLVGRVIKQLPVAGSEGDPGIIITLFVGKALK